MLPSATVLSQHSSVSFFNDVLTPEIQKLLNSTPALTLFLPINKAWDALDEYELNYLKSKYATDDLNHILNMHAVVQEGVKWSDSFDPAVNCKLMCLLFRSSTNQFISQ